MNSTALSAHVKYTLPFYTHISIDGVGSQVVAGRNVGQATSFMIGAYYVFSFKSSHNSSSQKN
jgi:hypothetical protein